MIEVLIIITETPDGGYPNTVSFPGKGDAGCMMALSEADKAMNAYFDGKAEWDRLRPNRYAVEVAELADATGAAEVARIKNGRQGQQ